MQAGRKILNLRCDRHISQQDLAKTCGMTPSALSKIEAGVNAPRANIVWRIAQNLGVTVEFLLDEEIPYPYPAYRYRHQMLEGDLDPSATVRREITREEDAFLQALRKAHPIAREISMAAPEVGVETLRMLHFIVHHETVANPHPDFLHAFENLVTTGSIEGEVGESKPTTRRGVSKKDATKKAKAKKTSRSATKTSNKKTPRGSHASKVGARRRGHR